MDALRNMKRLQSDLRICLYFGIGFPVVTLTEALFRQVSYSIAAGVCLSTVGVIIALKGELRRPNRLWFMWRGPIIAVRIESPERYAANVKWLQENYSDSTKILGTGVIKFRDAKIAGVFKLMSD